MSAEVTKLTNPIMQKSLNKQNMKLCFYIYLLLFVTMTRKNGGLPSKQFLTICSNRVLSEGRTQDTRGAIYSLYFYPTQRIYRTLRLVYKRLDDLPRNQHP